MSWSKLVSVTAIFAFLLPFCLSLATHRFSTLQAKSLRKWTTFEAGQRFSATSLNQLNNHLTKNCNPFKGTLERPFEKTFQFWQALKRPDPNVCESRRFKAFVKWHPIISSLVEVTLEKLVSKLEIEVPLGIKIDTLDAFDDYLEEYDKTERAKIARGALAQTIATTFNIPHSATNDFAGVLSTYHVLLPNRNELKIKKQQCFNAISKIYRATDFECDVLLKCLLFNFSDHNA
jgi:hypothetical protein